MKKYLFVLCVFTLLPLAQAQASGAGSALSFDGIDDHVVVASNASLSLSNSLTFEAWVYLTESRCNTILSRGDGGGNSDYIFQVGYDGLGNCNARTIGFWAAGAWDASISTVPLNAWTHVAVSYDGTNKSFYINGVLDRTVAQPGTLYQSGSPLFIGRQGSACNCNFFKGRMDELRIWNTVRTSNQISQNMSASLTGTETGLAAYYHFDEASGLVTADATGHGNTGTLTNGTVWIAADAPSVPGILSAGVSSGPITNLSLNALVIPNGYSTMAWFEWDTGPLYRRQTPPVSLGSGSAAVALNAALPGLTAGVSYHFRVVATNNGGVVRSGERRFWTPGITLAGANPLTSECHSFVDPGSSARMALQSVVLGPQPNTLAVRGDGAIAVWGDNFYGQLNVPANATNIIAVAAGFGHCLAVAADGSVIPWGRNDVFQVRLPAGLSDVVAVAANGQHSVALTGGGLVFAWAYYANGVVATDGISIAAGGQHGLAAKADGTVVGWGNNTYGQITIPPSATNIIAVAGGSQHSVGLRSDGTVVAWGANSSGQLNIPANATNVIAIAAGNVHTLALRADGTVVAWGNGFFGETIVPASATNVVAITAAKSSSLALRADGTTVAWGQNQSGQLNIPASAYASAMSLAVSGVVDSAFGTYTLTYNVTNEFGISSAATRTVVVSDTIAPTVSLLGGNPLFFPTGTAFIDPGATATDACAGDVTSNLVITGTVNTAVPAPYLLTYSAADPSGNTGTNSRSVFVTAVPSVGAGTASIAGTSPITGSGLVTLSANVIPNGLAGTGWLQFGLRTAQYGNGPITVLPADYAQHGVTLNLGGLIPGVTYHYRPAASNSLGVTYGPDQTFTVPAIFASGDINGDGVVDLTELNSALSNYWSGSSLYMTNPAVLGGGAFQFALTNVVGWQLGVQVSPDLVTWTNLPTGAFPVFQFVDPDGATSSHRFYRLRSR